MKNQTNNQFQDQSAVKPSNEKLFWYAFLGAIFIYSIVAIIISQTGEGFKEGKGFVGLDSEIFSVLFYILLLLSVIQLAILAKWNSKGVHELIKLLPDNRKKNIFMVKYILAEAIATYGLVLFLMNGNSNYLILFSSLAVIGMLLSYPKKISL